MHGPGHDCCYLWCERDTGIVTVAFEELTERGKGFKKTVSEEICLICKSSTSAHTHASVSATENNSLHDPGAMDTTVWTSSPEDAKTTEEGNKISTKQAGMQ
jgi:hypothetical protein